MSATKERPVTVEFSQATKVVITGVPDLDRITAFIEDYEPGRGKITINTFGQSWTAGWGAMAGRDVATFFCDCGAEYIAGCLSPMLRSRRYDAQVLVEQARTTIIERRRGRSLDYSDLEKDQARELFDETSYFVDCDNPYSLPSDTMAAIFGDEWRYYLDFHNSPNPDYYHLCRVIEAVQSALKQPEAAAA